MLPGLVLVALAQLSCGSEQQSDIMAANTPQYYCGSRLTSSLSLLCDGEFKRTDPNLSHNYIEYNEPATSSDYGSEEDPLNIYREKREAMSMTAKRMFRDRRGGVVSECCHKPCTIAELSSYCGLKSSS